MSAIYTAGASPLRQISETIVQASTSISTDFDEVEALRDQQDEHFGTSARPSLDQDGYDERDGETANRAQHSSRPSTVPEVDEEENEEYSAEKEFLSPQLPSEENSASVL